MVYKQTKIDPEIIEHNTTSVEKQPKAKKKRGQSYLSTPTLETYDLRAERLGNEFVTWAKNIRKDNREKRSKIFYGLEDFEIDNNMTGDDVHRYKKNATFKACIDETKQWLGLHTFAGLVEGSMKETYAKAILTDYSAHYSELIKKQDAYEDQRKKDVNDHTIDKLGLRVVEIPGFPLTDTVPVKKLVDDGK